MANTALERLFLYVAALMVLCACAPSMQQLPTEDPKTLFNAALAQKSSGNLDSAYQTFLHIWKKYPEDDLAPKALYNAASIIASTESEKAAELYRSFIKSYPRSELLSKVQKELLANYIKHKKFLDASEIYVNIFTGDKRPEMISSGTEIALGLVETDKPLPALKIIAMIYNHSDPESQDMLFELWNSTVEDIDQVEMLAELENTTQESQLLEVLLARETRLYLEQEDQGIADRIMDRLRSKSMQAPTKETAGKNTIGVMVPLSGKWEAVGQKVLKGVAFASKVFSNDKTPNVEYVIRDYGNEEDAITEIIEELDREHDVISIIGPIGETAGGIACKEAQARGIPSFMFTGGDIAPSEESYCFRNFVSVDIQVETLLQVASDMNITRFAILYPFDHFGNIFTNLFINNAPEYGIEIVRQVGYSPQLVDFKEAVNTLIADLPQQIPDETEEGLPEEEDGGKEVIIEPDFDALLIPDTAINAAMIATYLPYFSIEGVSLFGPTLWDSPDFLRVGGKYVDGAIFVSGFFINSELEFVQDFNNTFYYTFGYSPSVWEASAYDTAIILQNLMEGELHTRQSLREQIATIKGYPGLTGATSFYHDGSVNKSIYVLTIRGSNIFEIVP
jgi:branched-chain amino acid transport system substrate-binding protein